MNQPNPLDNGESFTKELFNKWTKQLLDDVASTTPGQQLIGTKICRAHLDMVEKLGLPASAVFVAVVSEMLSRMEFEHDQALCYTSFACDIADKIREKKHGKI